MQAIDVQAQFARAERAFAAGRLGPARADLAQVLRVAGEHPAVLHLAALVEKTSGDLAAARGLFERALAGAPADPQINNNYANLLDTAGDLPRALHHYDSALRAAPAFHDARYNRALLLQRLGRLDEGLSELDTIARAQPNAAKVQSARGGVLSQLDRADEAAAAFDAALKLEPDRPAALLGRARVALERGEPDAPARYRRALAGRPENRELMLGLALALEAEGNPDAVPQLEKAVRRYPDWREGHDQLARMRAEAGETDPLRGLEQAVEARPDDRALRLSLLNALMHSERFADALAAIDRAGTAGDDPAVLLVEAMCASELGDRQRAEPLLDQLGADEASAVVRGRHRLRVGDHHRASAELETFVAAQPDSIAAWALLGLAWRLRGDDRHAWLAEQPGLYGTQDLPLGAAEIARLAEVLRGLHRTRAHPIGQSLRGGTQTRGRLFRRAEPEIARLRELLRAAIGRHVAALPATDPKHPLLRHRNRRFAFDGSWSVRLTGSGFHINHIHPHGVLSSACYVSLPETLGDEGGREGWLEIGSPPKELGLPLDPLAVIEPRPGRLALFPSYLFHGTRPFATGERLTVAFDVTAS